MVNHYLSILTSYTFNIVYLSGGIRTTSPTIDLAYKPGEYPTNDDITLWTKEIHRSNFYGFDEIISLSEVGINAMFASIWSRSRRRTTESSPSRSLLSYFVTTSDAPAVRFMSNGSAIVWITVNRAELMVTRYAIHSRS